MSEAREPEKGGFRVLPEHECCTVLQVYQSTQLGKLHKIPGSNPLNHLKLRQAEGRFRTLKKQKKILKARCARAGMPAIVIVPVRKHIVQRKTESAFGISTLARECLLGRKGSKKHDLACG